ncbi:MAG: response regulator [Rhodospirillaceae bacterium]|nr:response regulator [Rhodospirillaceae bacterium]
MKNILIVDDSSVARMVVKSIIEKLSDNYTLLQACNAEEALVSIRDHDIHAMVLDHSMPDKLGMDLAADIRKTNPDIIISMMTANIQETMKNQAKAIGVGFIEKPPTEDKLKPFIDAIGG